LVYILDYPASNNTIFEVLIAMLVHMMIFTIMTQFNLVSGYTLSLTLREEHRLRVFENTVLRRIFGPKRDEVTGEWRKLHNEELRDLNSSPSIIRMI
jgi:hypothetical protein